MGKVMTREPKSSAPLGMKSNVASLLPKDVKNTPLSEKQLPMLFCSLEFPF